MTWITPNLRPLGFGGADAVLICETHLLALWNHERCRGWQLYQFCSPRNQTRTKWIAGASDESVGWTEDQAIAWAERMIAAV
ncbi:MAG: hypothetical protein ABSH08_13275 [Tepidisphaeraceae bacterium]|jgi:hypothetical protein